MRRLRWRDRIAARFTERASGMVLAAETGPRHGTRPRALALVLAGLGGLGLLFDLVSQNVLAVNFTSTNTAYDVYTDKVSGQHAAGYLNEQSLQNGTKKGVVQIGFKTATLNGLCAIADQNLPTLGPVSLMIVAGEKVDGTTTAPEGQTISAQELYLASDNLAGNGDQVAKLTLGQSADSLKMDTLPFAGSPGAFGLQAETLNVSRLDAKSYGIDLQGQINLPNLKIRVHAGDKNYADCAAQ